MINFPFIARNKLHIIPDNNSLRIRKTRTKRNKTETNKKNVFPSFRAEFIASFRSLPFRSSGSGSPNTII